MLMNAGERSRESTSLRLSSLRPEAATTLEIPDIESSTTEKTVSAILHDGKGDTSSVLPSSKKHLLEHQEHEQHEDGLLTRAPPSSEEAGSSVAECSPTETVATLQPSPHLVSPADAPRSYLPQLPTSPGMPRVPVINNLHVSSQREQGFHERPLLNNINGVEQQPPVVSASSSEEHTSVVPPHRGVLSGGAYGRSERPQMVSPGDSLNLHVSRLNQVGGGKSGNLAEGSLATPLPKDAGAHRSRAGSLVSMNGADTQKGAVEAAAESGVMGALRNRLSRLFGSKEEPQQSTTNNHTGGDPLHSKSTGGFMNNMNIGDNMASMASERNRGDTWRSGRKRTASLESLAAGGGGGAGSQHVRGSNSLLGRESRSLESVRNPGMARPPRRGTLEPSAMTSLEPRSSNGIQSQLHLPPPGFVERYSMASRPVSRANSANLTGGKRRPCVVGSTEGKDAGSGVVVRNLLTDTTTVLMPGESGGGCVESPTDAGKANDHPADLSGAGGGENINYAEPLQLRIAGSPHLEAVPVRRNPPTEQTQGAYGGLSGACFPGVHCHEKMHAMRKSCSVKGHECREDTVHNVRMGGKHCYMQGQKLCQSGRDCTRAASKKCDSCACMCAACMHKVNTSFRNRREEAKRCLHDSGTSLRASAKECYQGMGASAGGFGETLNLVGGGARSRVGSRMGMTPTTTASGSSDFSRSSASTSAGSSSCFVSSRSACCPAGGRSCPGAGLLGGIGSKKKGNEVEGTMNGASSSSGEQQSLADHFPESTQSKSDRSCCSRSCVDLRGEVAFLSNLPTFFTMAHFKSPWASQH
ncbi:unnamed protein product [Amoebophrya sp. A25]|nr:unnamed protein product [Amoebophrya sp. A25]|eukprot:GSA25T00006763001.1